MNDVHAWVLMRKGYETECVHCECFDNGYPCGRSREYQFKERGFYIYELHRESCDGYKRKKVVK